MLLARNKGLCSVVVPHWNAEHEGPEMPIIAGKLGHSWSESFCMEYEIGPELAKVICHPLRIAVLDEAGSSADPAAKTIVVMPQPAGQEG